MTINKPPNWQKLMIRLLKTRTTRELARQVRTSQTCVVELAHGKSIEPRFSLGLRLLKLSAD